LIEDLRGRGFEIGVHGLRHDGKLFRSEAGFRRRAELINEYVQELDALGFRSPLTMRNPEWMQALQIEYDLSFFDTDPCEPMPGGTMSIWPFFLGRFVELPYTLMQDCTLTVVLGETTPRLWLQKVEFIESYHGMVLVNTHPDYLSDPVTWKIYREFLEAMRHREGYWHALPREVARWWRDRTDGTCDAAGPRLVWGEAELAEEGLGLVLRPRRQTDSHWSAGLADETTGKYDGLAERCRLGEE
jgi:peptidoglycan/xylan/chitin deacetylase (PgdA/CDA1 family)